jgi:hypothetical protein
MRRPTHRLRKLLVAAAALGLVYLGGVALALLCAFAGVAPYLSRARWRWRPTALLLTPLLLVGGSFLHGVMTYATGTAHFEAVRPRTDFENLDRATRARGGEPRGLSWVFVKLTTDPNDAAIAWMARLFGPMPGAYKGPYPTEAETAAILSLSGKDISLDNFVTGILLLKDGPVPLNRSLAMDLVRQSGPIAEVWGAKVDGELLLLHFERPPLAVTEGSGYQVLGIRGDEPSFTWLVDLRGQQVVARYENFHLDLRNLAPARRSDGIHFDDFQ